MVLHQKTALAVEAFVRVHARSIVIGAIALGHLTLGGSFLQDVAGVLGRYGHGAGCENEDQHGEEFHGEKGRFEKVGNGWKWFGGYYSGYVMTEIRCK